jgi:hypothetical protein
MARVRIFPSAVNVCLAERRVNHSEIARSWMTGTASRNETSNDNTCRKSAQHS